ncbi:ABC transporter permease subunit [Paenibacillus sp. P26]|nr:ABC transporter permease subunit [Paenibacillus sp. P26]
MDFAGAYSPENLRFLMQGLYVTLKVAFVSIIFSFLIGALAGTLRFARIPVLSQVLAVLVELIRNLPLLLIIFFTRFLFAGGGAEGVSESGIRGHCGADRV